MKNIRSAEAKPGFKKILLSCRQSVRDALDYVWVDTCCIDKSSSAELSEAINSMYRWYEYASICYAYLSDVGVTLDASMAGDSHHRLNGPFPDREDLRATSDELPKSETKPTVHLQSLIRGMDHSRWFSRGWTLQELLAPRRILFYSAAWDCIGSRMIFASPSVESPRSAPPIFWNLVRSEMRAWRAKCRGRLRDRQPGSKTGHTACSVSLASTWR